MARKPSLAKETTITETLQKLIRERYGHRLNETRQRLCQRCKKRGCFLLPITSDGSDCPYFKECEQ